MDPNRFMLNTNDELYARWGNKCPQSANKLKNFSRFRFKRTKLAKTRL